METGMETGMDEGATGIGDRYRRWRAWGYPRWFSLRFALVRAPGAHGDGWCDAWERTRLRTLIGLDTDTEA